MRCEHQCDEEEEEEEEEKPGCEDGHLALIG